MPIQYYMLANPIPVYIDLVLSFLGLLRAGGRSY
jgi:hypothetical protein